MIDRSLCRYGGEFHSHTDEVEFQRDRLDETLRHVRLVLTLSAAVNTLFLITDWRFYGQPHFLVAIPARLTLIVVSLLAYLAIRNAKTYGSVQAALVVWQFVVALSVGLLVTAHSILALFVVMMLPSLFYLVIPTQFRWSLTMGVICSCALLAGYISSAPGEDTALGLAFAMIVLNVGLALLIIRTNRLERLNWAATQSEREAMVALEESRQQLESLFLAIPLPLLVTTLSNGEVTKMNEAARTYFTPSEQDEVMAEPRSVFSNLDHWDKLRQQLASRQQVDAFDTEVNAADGSLRNVLMAASRIKLCGVDSVVTGIVDITSRKQAEAEIQRLAHTDHLTGLPNRRLLLDRLNAAMVEGREIGCNSALIFIDLDHFKTMNDKLGHDAGDALLIEVGRRLLQSVRRQDTVARFGGDEFVIFASDIGPNSTIADEAVQRIGLAVLSVFQEPFELKGGNVAVSASIGAYVIDEHDECLSPDIALERADAAMYLAKSGGRNQMRIFAEADTPPLQKLAS